MSDTRRILEDDRLVQRRQSTFGKSSRGKRVAANCPLTRDEIRVYVTQSTIRACAKIMERGIKLHEAYKLLNLARYGTQQAWDAHAAGRDEA